MGRQAVAKPADQIAFQGKIPGSAFRSQQKCRRLRSTRVASILMPDVILHTQLPGAAMRSLTVFLLASMLAPAALSQDQKATKQPAKKKAEPNPAFAPVQDVAGLPRVLIIGDSISIGYQPALRESLKGKANVHRPAINCGPSTRGVEQIEQWLATDNSGGKWDLIHFNFGLHDVRHFDDQAKATDADKGHRQVSEADYEKNLELLVVRMKKTGAKLIFALTTPVPADSAGR